MRYKLTIVSIQLTKTSVVETFFYLNFGYVNAHYCQLVYHVLMMMNLYCNIVCFVFVTVLVQSVLYYSTGIFYTIGVSELLQNTWNRQSARNKALSKGSALLPAMPTSPTSIRTLSLAESVSQMMGMMSHEEDEKEEELDTQYVPTREC